MQKQESTNNALKIYIKSKKRINKNFESRIIKKEKDFEGLKWMLIIIILLKIIKITFYFFMILTYIPRICFIFKWIKYS